MKPKLPEDLARLLGEVPVLRRAYLVGGCVRDTLLGHPVKDFDIEVFGVGFAELAGALRHFGRVDLVGRSFGVVKLALGGAVHDFSIPRRDSKIGPGHQGFRAQFDSAITPDEAAARRDFTINALMYDPRRAELLDFFGGAEDLARRRLRHTSAAFAEDPLRVLRGMQFAARFDLVAVPETIELARGIADAYVELAVERVWEEWFKWASRSRVPSAGLRFLADSGWIRHFPEIEAIQGVPQDPEWHPEGDVFRHTAHCLDALVQLPEWQAADPVSRAVWSMTVLLHDAGKAVTTGVADRGGRPRIVSPGHEQASVRLAESFLTRLRAPGAIVERVLPLVAGHMAHFQEATDRAVRRLARRLQPETVRSLCVVMTADAFGRPPRPAQVPDSVDLLRRTAERLELAEAAPRPILRGRHLLALGLAPGPEVGRWIDRAFDAQLDGHFGDLPGAHAWLAREAELPESIRSAARRAFPIPNGHVDRTQSES